MVCARRFRDLKPKDVWLWLMAATEAPVELKVVEVEFVAVETSQVDSLPPGILAIEVLLHFTPVKIAVVDAPQVEGLLPGTPVAKVLDGMRQVRKLLQNTDTEPGADK